LKTNIVVLDSGDLKQRITLSNEPGYVPSQGGIQKVWRKVAGDA